MLLAFVAAMGNIGLEDVAVAGFQLFQDGGFVDDAGTAVVGECAEKNGVLADAEYRQPCVMMMIYRELRGFVTRRVTK